MTALPKHEEGLEPQKRVRASEHVDIGENL